MSAPGPLTLGTAGHIDHGKTSLVAALTGVDTDRLPEESARGLSIELGYAPLRLACGRSVSLIDVPGHSRFVRTMVAGATGIDAYLMVIAADDGVMPQTREHAAVLAALGITTGVVAVTKADLGDPARAVREAGELLPDAEVVVVSVPEGRGLTELTEALSRTLSALPGRRDAPGGVRLHVDRSFSVRGAGTVVTGTLWSGTVGGGDRLRVLPSGLEVRVRAVQVHDATVTAADPGQRVALNLVGAEVSQISRGDVVVGHDSPLAPTFRLDVALSFPDRALTPGHGDRVAVHHGTRESPARCSRLGGRFWQLRLEQPLAAMAGDRVVLRRLAPPLTLGGGVVLDAAPPRHGPTRDVIAGLTRLLRGDPDPPPVPMTQTTRPASPAPQLSDAALALEQVLQVAGLRAPILSTLTPTEQRAMAELRSAGRAVRAGRALHFHPDVVADVTRRVRVIVAAEGSITLARLRDELGTSRRVAQALLEHLDAARITRREPGDARVLRGN